MDLHKQRDIIKHDRMTNGQCTFVSYEIESKSEFIASMKDIASILSMEKQEESIE